MKTTLPVLALWFPLLACSSSSSSSGVSDPPAKDSGGGGVDAPTASPADAASPIGDPSQCAANPTGECERCCGSKFSGGATFLELALQDCICGGSRSCASLCSDLDCMTLSSPTASCEGCLQQMLPSCNQQIRSTCGSDSDCNAYMTCLGDCPQQ